MIRTVRNVTELDFTVVAEQEVDAYHVTYTVYDIEGYTPDGKPVWHKKDAPSYPDFVDTLEEADVYLHGDVKWDGCSNWHFDEQDRCMLHGCSKKDVQRFGDVLAYCWEWTRELLPNFDGVDK
jgi:hypothetical protein